MTITHVASSGVEAATTAKGSTATNVAYVGVATGRLAILMATVKLGSAAWLLPPPGWTLIADVSGGTGTSAVDVGTTRLGVWSRVLRGDESGNVTVNNVGGESSGGGMSVYASSLGGWVVPIAVTGDDTGHGTGRTAVCGAWASALAANDWVVMAHSSDTDGTGAVSAFTITQTSATFGTTVIRNQRLSSDGNDCGLYSGDVPVTAGNANAPTLGFTYATSQCGASAAIRLREQAPGVPGQPHLARWF